MKNTLLIILFGLFLTGCASTKNNPISPEMFPRLNEKSITVIKRESPSFVAMTSGKGMFAVLGVAAAVSEGNKFVKENNIVDPALDIGQSLANELKIHHGLIVKENIPEVSSGNISEITKAAHGSDYVLDIYSNGWGYIYDGFSFGDYFVNYSVKLRLIDVGTADVISSGFCTYDAKKEGRQAVSHDKLLENNAAYIKQEIESARNICIHQFKSTLF